ncbi:MAG TPA: EamA family transporter [Planctomycetaceae bacterium]
MSWHLLLPLTSSLLYAIAALLLKRAAALGSGVVQTTAVVNAATAVAFLTVLPLGGTLQADVFWQPAVVGLLFVAGQACTFLALKLGDVSVATPVMGVKTVIVAVLATLLLADRPPWQLWAAAALSAAAIALLNASGGERRRVVTTSLWALAAAGCYSLFDVLVQKWSPAWGAGRFLPAMAAVAALPAIAAWPVAKSVTRDRPRPAARAAWPWLAGGAGLMASQAVLLTGALAVFGDATAVNVVYSARGLWAVAAVMAVGHWFRNDERLLGPSVLRARLCGAAMMTVAIVIAMSA